MPRIQEKQLKTPPKVVKKEVVLPKLSHSEKQKLARLTKSFNESHQALTLYIEKLIKGE